MCVEYRWKHQHWTDQLLVWLKVQGTDQIQDWKKKSSFAQHLMEDNYNMSEINSG